MQRKFALRLLALVVTETKFHTTDATKLRRPPPYYFGTHLVFSPTSTDIQTRGPSLQNTPTLCDHLKGTQSTFLHPHLKLSPPHRFYRNNKLPMANNTTSPAPAAAASSPAFAGAGVAAHVLNQVNLALTALGNSVDTLTAAAVTLAGSSMSGMADALAAAAQVQTARVNAETAVSAIATIPTHMVPPHMAAPTQGAHLRNSAPWTAGLLYTVVPSTPLTSVPDNGGKWFAITHGKYISLTQNSSISLTAFSGISTGLSQKFNNQTDALNHFNGALAIHSLAVLG
ncbi:hypothetical protein B0H16DRAFT_1750693 [Mycena metata]|uniref:Uncharacterized protein n=1 Tax=Mycena metata TaxID=1033252 RepID=A0AAD7DQX3_9AGAR|nr:hypothetical protein B0H16DRAFT_1750693 [Mycena metata]